MKSTNSFRQIVIIAIFAVGALPSLAGDLAILKNGFSIRHERREVFGDVTRLYVSADGSSFVDVPTAQIEHFEPAPGEIVPNAQPANAAGIPASGSIPPASGSRRTASIPNFDASKARLSSQRDFFRSELDLNRLVMEASGRYRLDPDLVNSVIKAESGFNVRAVSPKGAQGLMQLMPGTASQLGVPNSFDPQANVEGGARYLRELLEHYNFDMRKALAAYNAGPEKVERYRGIPPYYETRAYVARVVKDFNRKKTAQEKASSRKPQQQASAKTKASKAAAKPVAQAKASAPSE